jgi:hypothetical protein
MINEQTIPCPVCKNQIPFEVTSLLKGSKFTCTNCQSAVALSSDSKEEVKTAIEKYEKLKLKANSKKNN